MSSITGREALIGLKKASTWGTAVACGADDGLLILNESLRQTLEHIEDDSAGLAFIQRTDKGKTEVTGSIEGYMRYQGWDVALALITGAAGTPSLAVPSTLAYINSFTLDTDNDGKFATIAMKKKSDKIFEYPSVKLHKFTLSGSMNAPIKIALEAIANKLELASSVNTTTTIASVTYPDKGNRVIFNGNAHFYINDQSGARLDSGDAVYPTEFEFSFNRPMVGEAYPGSDEITEPFSDGFPEITLTLRFPRYNDTNDAFFADWDAFTSKKGEIYFRGSLIDTPTAPAAWAASTAYAVNDCVSPTSANGYYYKATVAGTSDAAEPTWPTALGETVVDGGVTWECVATSYYYDFKISMPHLKVVDPNNAISGPGKIPLELTFKVLGTDTAPTGMTGITTPFQIDVTNERSTSPLA